MLFSRRCHVHIRTMSLIPEVRVLLLWDFDSYDSLLGVKLHDLSGTYCVLYFLGYILFAVILSGGVLFLFFLLVRLYLVSILSFSMYFTYFLRIIFVYSSYCLRMVY